MPAIQTIDLSPRRKESGLDAVLGSFAKKQNENMIEEQDTDALRDIYAQYQRDGSTLEEHYARTEQDPRLSPTAKINSLKHIETQMSYNNEVQKELLKQANKTPKLNKFEETVQADAGHEYGRLGAEVAKGKDAITNLDRIINLSENELSGGKGYVKSLFNTESAAEMENLGFTAIEPIIKLFNPVGPIPVQKVTMIRNSFQPKASDTQSTIRGKVSALKRIGNQAIARAEKRQQLLFQHKGLIPPEELQKFDAESEQLSNVLFDQEAWELKTKELNDNEFVPKLYGVKDGKEYNNIPKKEAMKLFQQGILTNIPPERA